MSPGPRFWICWCDTDTVLHCVMFARFSYATHELGIKSLGTNLWIALYHFNYILFCFPFLVAQEVQQVTTQVEMSHSTLSFRSRCQYSSTAAFTLLLQKLYTKHSYRVTRYPVLMGSFCFWMMYPSVLTKIKWDTKWSHFFQKCLFILKLCEVVLGWQSRVDDFQAHYSVA
jgi:hypothetical protein